MYEPLHIEVLNVVFGICQWASEMGRKLADLCPVKDCKARPVMPIKYLDEEGMTQTTAVCEMHWDEFTNRRPRHLGPPLRFLFKEDITIRNI